MYNQDRIAQLTSHLEKVSALPIVCFPQCTIRSIINDELHVKPNALYGTIMIMFF